MGLSLGHLRARRCHVGAGWCFAIAGGVARFTARVAQMPFHAAVKHKLIVFEVAADAAAEERRPLLGVLYDEIAR